MLYSMTGYGRVKVQFDTQTVVVEVRSLNSKSFDLRMRMPLAYQAKEIELRRLLNRKILRGKVDVSLSVDQEDSTDHNIDGAAFAAYYKKLTALAQTHQIDNGDLLYTVTRMPGVIVQNDEEVSEEDWANIMKVIDQALAAFLNFRKDEGAALEKDIRSHVGQILELLKQVEPFEQGRIDKIRARLESNMEQWVNKKKMSIDDNRLEQEMIYYLDKFDVSEEKMRLAQHGTYFYEVLDGKDASKGKKLNFIVQEMGREINTLGAKANSADIQKLVVQMKNQLDKIKEQLANVL